MIIAQISDTHISIGTPDAKQKISDFEAVISDISYLAPTPDVIIHTGDITDNGRQEEYEKSIEILSKTNVPFYGMVGNKDNRILMPKTFQPEEYFSSPSNFVDYSIDEFPVKLIVLDTLCSDNNKGDFCEKRTERFQKMVMSEASKPLAIFMHHPPCEIKVGPEAFHFSCLDTMSNLRKTIIQSQRVIAIFCGHVHRSTSGTVGKIPVTVMSAVATTLRKGKYPQHMEKRPTYKLHRFDNFWGGFVTETRIAGGL